MSDTSGPQSVQWALFSFKGRIVRKTFILGQLFMLSLFAVVFVQIVKTPEHSGMFALWGLVLLGLMFVSAWSVAALSVKRLHDMGFPGVIAICVFIPALTWIALLVLAVYPAVIKPMNMARHHMGEASAC